MARAASCCRRATLASSASTRASCPTSCRRRAPYATATGASHPITTADLQRRWVELTGPTDRKMLINALNSGADVYMADFEDANAPTWSNMIEGQLNVVDAVRRTIAFDGPDGRSYRLNDQVATLLRPPARLAPARTAPAGRRPADRRRTGRLRPVLLPQRALPGRARQRARTSTCPSSRTIARRGSGTTSSTSPRMRSACRAERSRRPC